MPSIQFDADERDFEAIFARLADDSDIALIVPPDGDDADIWAFPGALAKIRSGVHRDANPSG